MDLTYSTVTRITGEDESLAVDVVEVNDATGSINAMCSKIIENFTSGVQASITVSTSSIEAKCGATRIAGRKVLAITPVSGKVFYGLTNAVTIANGTPLFKNQTVFLPFLEVYLIASESTDVRVLEAN
jgi:predicted AAA+ superfamily ATPase